MTTKQAVAKHGKEISEEIIGTEDRLIGYADGSFSWQARGSDQVWFGSRNERQACYSSRDAAIADYISTAATE